MIPLRHVDTFRTRECVIESNRLILGKGKKGSTMLTIVYSTTQLPSNTCMLAVITKK